MHKMITMLLIGMTLGGVIVFIVQRRVVHSPLRQAGVHSERDMDIGLGHALVNSLSSSDCILRLIESNQIQKAHAILLDTTWWEMKNAWLINNTYDKALESELAPLFPKIYPHLKQQLDFDRYKNFPKSSLQEMSNFMSAVEIQLQNPKSKGSDLHRAQNE
jgi:hypothetical protein